MNTNLRWIVLPILLAAFLLAACAPASTPVPAPTIAPSESSMDMGGTDMSQPTAEPTSGMEMGQPTAEPMGAGLMTDQPVPSQGVQPATETEGGQLLPFTLDGDVKVFELTAQPVLWKINPDTQVTAWTYNGTAPGPLFRVVEGDKVRVIFKNTLPEPTSIHWHGLPVPSNMDGVAQPELSQSPVMPGETFTYEFEAKPAGTFMYHSHYDTDTQINVGLFGGFVIEPKNWAEVKPDQAPVHPGERFDIEFVADNPGQWAFHCHIVHHATNDDVEPGGLLFVVNVQS